MAYYKETFRENGTNADAIVKSESFVGRFRWRMDDKDAERVGACTALSISNDSAQEAILTFYTGVETNADARIYKLKAGTIKNIGPEDGIAFYAFDVLNQDTVTDIAAGKIRFTAARVEQVREAW